MVVIKFPTLPLVTFSTKIHHPSMGQEVGKLYSDRHIATIGSYNDIVQY